MGINPFNLKKKNYLLYGTLIHASSSMKCIHLNIRVVFVETLLDVAKIHKCIF